MNWFFTLVRSVGASFPGSASMVQLQAEIDSRETQRRLRALEDPVSGLHPDVRGLSKLIYDRLRSSGNMIHVDEDMYARFARPLHILDSQGLIDVTHVIGRPFPDSFWVTNSSYIFYLCALFEDSGKMDSLVNRIDEASAGRWLRGAEFAAELDLPLPVVKAIFQLYERRGLGLLSKEIGTANYYVKA